MITTNSAFDTANASLNKKPIYALWINLYDKIFTTAACTGTLFPYLGVGALVGAFTDSSGNVIQPVGLGSGYQGLKTPAGATQFQIGISDDVYNDNTGSFAVRVNGSTLSVPATTIPWDPTLPGNSAYQFGSVAPNTNGGTSPIVAASGLSTGQIITVKYISGIIAYGAGGPFGTPPVDADGDPAKITGASFFGGGNFPTAFLGVSTVDPWITNVDDLQLTVSDLDGSADLADFSCNVQDRAQAITADLPNFIFEGKRCQLLVGFLGMTLDQFVPYFTGVMDTVDSDNTNTEYKFTAANLNLKKLSAKIYTISDADANGNTFTTDSKHPRSLNGHPMDLLVAALLQAGVSSADIDTAKINYYRDFIFSGRQFVFSLTSAPTAKNFIEDELMKPMGMYLWENNLGKLSINSFYPAIFPFGGYTPAGPPARTLDIDNTTLIPLAMEAALVNQVINKFDDDGSGQQFNAENISQYDISIAKYGLTDGHTIESQGLKSSFQGYFHAELISFLIFLRYGSKNLVLDGLPALWTESVLEPGDIIALTEQFVPDRAAGVLGITAQYFEVMDRTWHFMGDLAGTVELKLLAIDFSKFKQYLITPNAEADFAADSAPNQAKYMYLSDAPGKYSTGVDANTMG